jgi:hypothetical protein
MHSENKSEGETDAINLTSVALGSEPERKTTSSYY